MTDFNYELNPNQTDTSNQTEQDTLELEFESSSVDYSIDADDQEDIREAGPIVKVIGVGGAGCKLIESIAVRGDIKNINLAALNTDGKALNTLKRKVGKVSNLRTLQLGPEFTRGLGAGSMPEKGAKAAEESEAKIRELLEGCDMVFITVGLGGGTGTGASPLVARIAKELKILTIAVATAPFYSEGKHKWRVAMEGMQKLKSEVDSLIILPNQQIVNVFGDNGVQKAYDQSDEVLLEAVRGVIDLIYISGDYGGVDFQDICTCMRDSELSVITTGTARSSPNCAIEALEKALNNPMQECDFSNAKGIVGNIFCDRNMKLREQDLIKDNINKIADDEAITKIGIVITEAEEDHIRVVLIISGIKMNGLEMDSRDKAINAKELQKSSNTPLTKRINQPIQQSENFNPSHSQNSSDETKINNPPPRHVDFTTPTYRRMVKPDSKRINTNLNPFAAKVMNGQTFLD